MNGQHQRPGAGRGARGGFTLLELLTVVVVLGIVSAITIPATSNMLAQTRVSKAATMISSDLQTAFSIAAREKRPLVVTVTAAEERYLIADRDGEVIVRRSFATGSEDLSVNSMTTNVAQLHIYPNGMASGILRITVVVGDHTRRVQMSRVGHIRVSAP
ncbi:MAG: prepilin-type N-terminal cleavage/methylation domain-containing protein [Gemmatimonadota bacterium]